jgi:hypothetical protein
VKAKVIKPVKQASKRQSFFALDVENSIAFIVECFKVKKKVQAAIKQPTPTERKKKD